MVEIVFVPACTGLHVNLPQLEVGCFSGGQNTTTSADISFDTLHLAKPEEIFAKL